ncbi:unnamed protein product, partial [Protopolystoma xenopodis]
QPASQPAEASRRPKFSSEDSFGTESLRRSRRHQPTIEEHNETPKSVSNLQSPQLALRLSPKLLFPHIAYTTPDRLMHTMRVQQQLLAAKLSLLALETASEKVSRHSIVSDAARLPTSSAERVQVGESRRTKSEDRILTNEPAGVRFMTSTGLGGREAIGGSGGTNNKVDSENKETQTPRRVVPSKDDQQDSLREARTTAASDLSLTTGSSSQSVSIRKSDWVLRRRADGTRYITRRSHG